MGRPVLQGPLETSQFPEKLTARVVKPGAEPHLRGYDVEGDLAVHYGMADTVLLALTGELPSDRARAAFEVASMFLSSASVADAGPHAAVLARLCGATASSTVGVAAIGLAEQARALLDAHTEFLAWLESKSAPLPARYAAATPDPSVARLRDALTATGLVVPALAHELTRDAALLSVLFACGLERTELLQAAVVLARLPAALAEGFAEETANFGNYPINLPAFAYEEEA